MLALEAPLIPADSLSGSSHSANTIRRVIDWLTTVVLQLDYN